jgi:hypothetical protein
VQHIRTTATVAGMLGLVTALTTLGDRFATLSSSAQVFMPQK